jgi:hypothetical protein
VLNIELDCSKVITPEIENEENDVKDLLGIG